MGTEKVRKALKNIGLTEKEIDLYIFLAKHHALRSGEIAKGTHTHRVEIYRILKSLQVKGAVEATLEAPSRFMAVPLETILDAFIKAKRQETAQMENTKQGVLTEWENISKSEPQVTVEKFAIVEGNKKIYAKLLNMVKDTESQLSAVTTATDLTRADQFGVLDAAFNHPLKDKIKFHFLTDLSDANLNIARTFFKKISKTGIDFKGRNPNLGLKLSPRMAIRDKKELLFFIRPNAETTTPGQHDVCLWTNCKALVQSFSVVFEDLWANSTGINEKIEEIESGRTTPAVQVIPDINTAIKTYDHVISAAKEEILIMTSSEGLIESQKRIALLKDLSRKGVSIKIMAPITSENWQAMQDLSNFCIVKHVPTRNIETTIVDGKCIFQSANKSSIKRKEKTAHLSKTSYSYDLEYVEKAKKILNEAWRDAPAPSTITLESLIKDSQPADMLLYEEELTAQASTSPYNKLVLDLTEKPESITEKYILNQMINAKKYPAKNWPKDILRFYGSTGHAIIHPPETFNLPEIMIWVMHLSKQSSFGAQDLLVAYLWLETHKEHSYVPVAAVTDNPESVNFHKSEFAGTPAEFNVQVVKKDEFQVRFHGNTFFAGWTKPIQLFPANYILPPSCLLLEGYGKLKSSVSRWSYPSGIKVTAESNSYDAFVTYFHPASKYSGPGTDGRINRDIITTMYPP